MCVRTVLTETGSSPAVSACDSSLSRKRGRRCSPLVSGAPWSGWGPRSGGLAGGLHLVQRAVEAAEDAVLTLGERLAVVVLGTGFRAPGPRHRRHLGCQSPGVRAGIDDVGSSLQGRPGHVGLALGELDEGEL